MKLVATRLTATLPSQVVFTDEQALMGDKATLYSSTSDEAMSIPSVKDDQSSQPESQVGGASS